MSTFSHFGDILHLPEVVSNVCGQNDQLDEVKHPPVVSWVQVIKEPTASGVEDGYGLSKMVPLYRSMFSLCREKIPVNDVALTSKTDPSELYKEARGEFCEGNVSHKLTFTYSSEPQYKLPINDNTV